MRSRGWDAITTKPVGLGSDPELPVKWWGQGQLAASLRVAPLPLQLFALYFFQVSGEEGEAEARTGSQALVLSLCWTASLPLELLEFGVYNNKPFV